MASSRPSETTAAACTPTPTSIACASCTARWPTATASAGWRRSPTRSCASWPANRARARRPRRTTLAGTPSMRPRSPPRSRATTPQPSIGRCRDSRPSCGRSSCSRDALMPTLAQVGDEWHRRRASIAQEHLMSSTMRNILGSFLRVYAQPHAPARLLFATLAASATPRTRHPRRRAPAPPAAGSASPISGPTFPPVTSSTA